MVHFFFWGGGGGSICGYFEVLAHIRTSQEGRLDIPLFYRVRRREGGEISYTFTFDYNFPSLIETKNLILVSIIYNWCFNLEIEELFRSLIETEFFFRSLNLMKI